MAYLCAAEARSETNRARSQPDGLPLHGHFRRLPGAAKASALGGSPLLTLMGQLNANGMRAGST